MKPTKLNKMGGLFLGLGANLGTSLQQLQWAVNKISRQEGYTLDKISSLYQTTPIGGGPQPDYLNAVISLQTACSPRVILNWALDLEKQAGRIRTIKNAPRLLDIDILLYNGKIISEPGLQVPHYRLAERPFMLVPLAEIAPEVRHPVLNKTAAELLAQVSAVGVRCLMRGPAWAKLSEEQCP